VSEADLPTRAEPALVKALARAFRYQRLLDKGRYSSISEMAAAEKIERGYLGTLLRLTLLAPDVVEAILNGRQLSELQLSGPFRPIQVGWDQQCCRYHLWPARRTRSGPWISCRTSCSAAPASPC